MCGFLHPGNVREIYASCCSIFGGLLWPLAVYSHRGLADDVAEEASKIKASAIQSAMHQEGQIAPNRLHSSLLQELRLPRAQSVNPHLTSTKRTHSVKRLVLYCRLGPLPMDKKRRITERALYSLGKKRSGLSSCLVLLYDLLTNKHTRSSNGGPFSVGIQL